MINHITKICLIASLLFSTFQSYAVDIPFTARDITIGVSALAVGIAGTAVGAYLYHPASLEKMKLEQEQEEKKKKELAEHAEKEKQRAAELHKLQALNVLLNVKHTYADEFDKLRKEKLNERDSLLNIIKENCGMRDMPLNQYHTELYQTLDSLKNIEPLLPSEKQQERLTLVSNLERILKVYNTQIADKAKLEKDELENRRKKEETEQRKIEKEQLEIKKLRLEVDSIRDTKHELAQINNNINALSNTVVVFASKQNEHSQEIMGSVNALRAKQAHDAQEIKMSILKGSEGMEGRFAVLFKLFDQARQYVNQMVSQPQQPVANPQPSYSPEYYQQPMPIPSAPPL